MNGLHSKKNVRTELQANFKYISMCLNDGIGVSDCDNHNHYEDDDDVEQSAISHLPTPAIWHCRPPRSPTLKPEA